MKKTLALYICILCISLFSVGCDMNDNMNSGESSKGSDTESASFAESADSDKTEEQVSNSVGATTDSEETVALESETESPYLAPDLTLYDLEGNAVRLSDFRGKPIVLNFWARDCIYCTLEMPDFQAAYEKYGADVEFLMVAVVGFSKIGVSYEQEHIDQEGYTFPVYFDTDNQTQYLYGTSSLPKTFFIDRDFDLYTYIPGYASAELLETCIGYIIE